MKKTRLRLRRHNLLPEELLAEILSRLSVKSLLRFHSVSKSWRAMIDDPHFTRSHLLRFYNNRHETHLLIGGWQQGFEVRSTKSLKITIASRILQAGMPAGEWHVISSVDGLFMLRSSYPTRTTMLWNPATRETLIPPPCPGISKKKETSVELGLGFDPLAKDYKYVKFLYTKPAHILHSIAVYSLATNSWKMTRFDQGYQWRRYQSCEPSSILCLRGVLFFLATNTPQGPVQLVSFDLRSQSFTYSTKLPIEDHERDDLPVHYGPFSDSPMKDDTEYSLAVVNLWPAKGSGSVWTLEGLGADDMKSRSWSKRYTFASMIPEFDSSAGKCKFFYLRKNGEMLLEWKSMITSYNLKTHKEKVLLRKSLGSKAWPYMESLVMLK